MGQNYLQIRNEYLTKAWVRSAAELQSSIPARIDGEILRFPAFGEECALTKDAVSLSEVEASGPEGLLIAMYASTARDVPLRLHPLKSFKELPNSMPYQAAFRANAELVLVPHVSAIKLNENKLIEFFSGHPNPDAQSGDFSFTLYPLPRVPLYYIFNLPDEEFPASVTCLFCSNAVDFMPLDGLADVAEYTAKRIITLLRK